MITAWDLVLKYAPFYCEICRMQQAHVVTPSLLKSCYVMATDVRITPSKNNKHVYERLDQRKPPISPATDTQHGNEVATGRVLTAATCMKEGEEGGNL